MKRQKLKVIGDVYNTIGLNDCPEAQWKSLNASKLKSEWKADALILNGPSYFMMDRNALKNPGGVSTFDGMQMRWLAKIELPLMRKRQPYTETTVDLETQYVYEAGKLIYQLHGPDGKSYMLQSYSQEQDPNLKEDDLTSLSSKLHLPKRWTFSSKRSDQDMVVKTTDGKAHVLQDNLRNSYQRL